MVWPYDCGHSTQWRTVEGVLCFGLTFLVCSTWPSVSMPNANMLMTNAMIPCATSLVSQRRGFGIRLDNRKGRSASCPAGMLCVSALPLQSRQYIHDPEITETPHFHRLVGFVFLSLPLVRFVGIQRWNKTGGIVVTGYELFRELATGGKFKPAVQVCIRSWSWNCCCLADVLGNDVIGQLYVIGPLLLFLVKV